MAQIINVSDPLRTALQKLGAHNVKKMDKLRISKDFAYLNGAFVGFEGGDKEQGTYFCLRVDYDPKKLGHVNLTMRNSEKYEYTGQTESWYRQVIENINGGAYCDVPRDSNKTWQTSGQETNATYIQGMKKYMERYLS